MENTCDNCLFALHNSNCNAGENNIYCTKGVIEILTRNNSVCDDHVFKNSTMEESYIDTSKVLDRETFIKLLDMFNNVELWKIIRDNIDDETFQKIINLNASSETLNDDVNNIIKLRLNKKNNHI